ncbi:hypothetical protein BD410DRAFT_898672 [Rickenella mellea]|uniref:Ricin B lectin domain-containing protein n=1 Tax=Rickenella mellea TaxID=50990 RepID=A0A4Y7Q2H6_9AGAM|nr:hypothetical protein BD410DRAFT_898672 [Rickenella mellea]
MISPKYLLALICLPSFSVGLTSATNVGLQALIAGPVNVVSGNDPKRILDLSFSLRSSNNPVIATGLNPSPTPNQQWLFNPTGAPNTFQIQNGVSPAVFLSYPSAPTQGSIRFAQGVIQGAATAFVINEFNPGSPFLNITVGGFALTYWPAPNPSIQSPLTFEVPGGALTPFQNWTLVPVKL